MSEEESDHEIQIEEKMGPGRCFCHYKPRVCRMNLWKFLFLCTAVAGIIYLNKQWIIPSYCPSLSDIFSSISSIVQKNSGRDHRRPKIIHGDSSFENSDLQEEEDPFDSDDDQRWHEMIKKLDTHRESSTNSSKPEKDQQLPIEFPNIPPSPPRYNLSTERIVFLKTHRTAGSTVASLFKRYGYNHKLFFALPKNLQAKDFLQTVKFHRSFIFEYPWVPQQKYNILASHARYERTEMEFVVPKATFITILRKPEDQFESMFGFHNIAEDLDLQNTSNPLEKFVDGIKAYYKTEMKFRLFFKNGQLFDLGMDEKDMDDERKIYAKIKSLEEEFDLVLIREYFDESLILLKKLLGWKDDDILYFSSRVRSSSHRYEMNDNIKAKIRQWNKGDVMLYEHFNKTLQWKIQEYGPSFQEDLERFRRKNREVFDDCVDKKHYDSSDRRLKRYVLSNFADSLCKELNRNEYEYHSLLRSLMISNKLFRV